jgi:hypothetical protein
METLPNDYRVEKSHPNVAVVARVALAEAYLDGKAIRCAVEIDRSGDAFLVATNGEKTGRIQLDHNGRLNIRGAATLRAFFPKNRMRVPQNQAKKGPDVFNLLTGI